jgi:hypothetical protein
VTLELVPHFRSTEALMALGRTLPRGVAALLLLAGCGSMGNTLAQDLAWQRIEKCQRIGAAVTVTRVEPNGTIWYEWRGGSQGISEFDACLKNAAAEQAKQQRVAPPAAQAVSTEKSPQPADSTSAAVPVWKPGYEWAYRYENPAGNGTYVWSVDREEALDGVPHYVIKTGSRETFYRKSDFAFTRDTVDGVLVLKSTPPRLQCVWPLEVGKTWDQTILEERPKDRQTIERIDMATVETEETVTVPAGTFKTLKVVYRNKKTGATRYEAWYSPELKQVVKLRENRRNGVQVRELIAFKLR